MREALTSAEERAKAAVRGDGTWAGLLGGLQSLRIAIESDDARAARVGIDVVRAECRRLSP